MPYKYALWSIAAKRETKKLVLHTSEETRPYNCRVYCQHIVIVYIFTNISTRVADSKTCEINLAIPRLIL